LLLFKNTSAVPPHKHYCAQLPPACPLGSEAFLPAFIAQHECEVNGTLKIHSLCKIFKCY